METAKILSIIRSLADGIDPETGKPFDLTHPYQHPNTIRALFAAAQALEQGAVKEHTHAREQSEAKLAFQSVVPPNYVVPPNAGKPWTEEEDQRLCSSLDTEISISQLAEAHGRTYGDIHARLEALGQLEKAGQAPSPFPEIAGPRTPPEPAGPDGMYVFQKMAFVRESAASTH